jgi:hypothetical protein
MTEQCFMKKDSNPPVCGVHNKTLQRIKVSIDSQAAWLGNVTCDLCPASRAVVREPKQPQSRSSFQTQSRMTA